MAKARKDGRAGGRRQHGRVNTAAKRPISSARWLERQLNDPYVRQARAEGWRSRAAYKLIELDDRFGFLKPGQLVVDLGAAPGGWSQVAAVRTGAAEGRGRVVALDILAMDPLSGVEVLTQDFAEADAPARLRAVLGGPADLVLSDMAPDATGHRTTDHLRIVLLVELAAEFALEVLKPGGTFVTKVWQGGADGELLDRLKRAFARVRHAKPPASRKESPEVYLVADGFRGLPEEG